MKYKTGDIAKYKRQLIYKKGRPAQLCFNKQEFLDEVFGLLEDMYYDDGDDVDIHVYTVGNCT